MASRKSRKRQRRAGFRSPQQSRSAAAEPPPRGVEARRRTARDERPPAPWGSFPLVELVILLALVVIVAGFFTSGTKGLVMIGLGLTLGSLAGLEVSIREHFAGYRSHTLLLAGAVTIVTLAVLFLTAPDLPPPVRLGIAAALFGATLWLFREAFRRRSGGLTVRVRGFRG